MARKSKSVSGESAAAEPVFNVPANRLHDPSAYSEASIAITNARGRGAIKATDATRDKEMLRNDCLEQTGVELADAGRQRLDPVQKLDSVLETNSDQLDRLIDAIGQIDDIRATDEKKKRWIGIIRRCQTLQAECRADSAKATVYFLRNDIPGHVGQLLHMKPFHLKMHEIWADPETPHSVIMAPPGHAKSTNLRGYMAWEFGHKPELRCLYLTDETHKARKTIRVMHRVMRSPLYRALFPEVRVLGVKENEERSSRSFTLARGNWQSRDPSLEAASITSSIQGNRYDRIRADDPSPEDVRRYGTLRDTVGEKMTGVVENRLSDGRDARISIVATPWHQDDIPCTIIRAVDQGDLTNWRYAIFPIQNDSQGNPIPIWPEMWDQKYLISRRTRRADEYRYLFQLNAAADGKVIVRRVHYYNSVPRAPGSAAGDQALVDRISQAERWLVIDPAGTAGKLSSDTGAVECVLSPHGYAFVTAVWAWHIPIMEVIENVAELIIRSPEPGYSHVMWESVGAVRVGLPAVLDLLRRGLKDRGFDDSKITIFEEGIHGTGLRSSSKIARLKQCAGYLDTGLIRFAGRRAIDKRIAPGDSRRHYLKAVEGSRMETLIRQLREFDGHKHTDGVDALTLWILKNKHRINSEVDQAHAPANAPQPQQRGSGLRFGEDMDRMIDKLLNPDTGTFADEEAFVGGKYRQAS